MSWADDMDRYDDEEAIRKGLPIPDYPHATIDAMTPRTPQTPPPCSNCHHGYGEHDGWHMLGVPRRDWTPRLGGACGFSLDFHHTCSCRRYVAPQAEPECTEDRTAQVAAIAALIHPFIDCRHFPEHAWATFWHGSVGYSELCEARASRLYDAGLRSGAHILPDDTVFAPVR